MEVVRQHPWDLKTNKHHVLIQIACQESLKTNKLAEDSHFQDIAPNDTQGKVMLINTIHIKLLLRKYLVL